MMADNSNSTVLVVGATGYVGRNLVKVLHERGHRVRVLVRSRARAEQKGAHGAPSLDGLVDEWVEGDPRNIAHIIDLMNGVDHVMSALGVTRQKADPWDIDFRANLALLEAAERSDVRSFLYVNVMNVHEGTSGVARSKAAFSEALRRSSVTPLIVNPSGYFSDLTELLQMARKGVAVRLGAGGVRLAPIHGRDLADFCVDRIAGLAGEWDIGGPDTLTYRQILDLAFAAVGKAPRWVVLPAGISRPAIWIADRLGPRASSLARFFLEGLQHDAVGEPTGSHHLRDYFLRTVAELEARPLPTT